MRRDLSQVLGRSTPNRRWRILSSSYPHGFPSSTHWTPVTVSFGGWLQVLRRRLASFLTNLDYLNWICRNPDPNFCDIKTIATKLSITLVNSDYSSLLVNSCCTTYCTNTISSWCSFPDKTLFDLCIETIHFKWGTASSI